jgi:hydrogenase/urease accessory protein HupE/outer membrane receptor protein involved in Fe transport
MGSIHRVLLTAAALLLPGLAQAHTGSGAIGGLGAGFSHPLLGWDHLLAMLAVGIWAAQQRGRAVLGIPLAFVAAMSLGGAAGVHGLAVPAVEPLIALSVLVFGVLVGVRARLRVLPGMLLAGFFAFFHGFAHGSEIPPSASFVSFGVGFVAATLLLHGLGWLLARLVAGSLLFGSSALAQDSKEIEKIEVRGRADSLVGIADSATEGTVGFEQLDLRPTLRTGEILETVPGVIITQHAGGGKANQYFLRGFNLDHGTDFATSMDGMPVNLPTHGHGQGYTDLNGLIPELVERVNYRKGPYYAEVGDFGSAGAAELQLFETLEKTLLRVEYGNMGHYRGLIAGSADAGPGSLLYGLDASRYDGPWKERDDFERTVGIARYTQGDDDGRFSLTAMGYQGDWDSSDQIARSAVPVVGRFGTLDDTTGGDSQRYSLSAAWDRGDENRTTRISGYVFYYDLDLFSNFTYFLDDDEGDQFEQVDRRWTTGLEARHSRLGQLDGRDVKATVGLQAPHDSIRNGLLGSQARNRQETVRDDRIHETSAGPFFEAEIQWCERFRSVAGVRADWYRFYVDDSLDLNSDSRDDLIASPKLSLIFGPWGSTEFYLQGGLGFHSNDARGVNTRIDPVSLDPLDRADPLVRTHGAEAGMRASWLPGLHSTASVWMLDLDSELVFIGDAGTTEAGRPSRRYGIELANYWSPTGWLDFDLDFSLSRARFRDNPREAGVPIGRHVPGSIQSVLAAGVTLKELGGFSGGLRLRYFGPRPLSEDNDAHSGSTTLVSASLGYRFNETWSLEFDVFNLFDREDSDIEYFYESRIAPLPTDAAEEIHFHPVESTSARVGVTARF